MIILIFIILIICGFIYIYYTFKKTYKFWYNLNVPYLQPIFPFGNVIDSMKQKHFAYIAQDLYEKLKHHKDYAGIYFFKNPTLLVTSPEFAKTILIKDFPFFIDRGLYFNKKLDPLSANLFFIEGQEWRNLRAKISPTFTTGKIKMMFETIKLVADQMDVYLKQRYIEESESGKHSIEIEIKDIMARFTTDIIGSCAFGLECNSIMNPMSEFREMGRKMFSFSKLKTLKIFMGMLFRKQAQLLRLRFNDEEVTDFIIDIVKETIKHRRSSAANTRQDFMQLMIDMYSGDGQNYHDDSGLTVEEIAAQAFVFFFAGFETSSTTMTYALYELAINQTIQNKVRDEINTILEKFDQTYTYESVNDMTYLDNVISETLRKYPPVATIHRVSSMDYRLPNNSVIPAGTHLLLPTYGFHHDKDIYPNPDQFDPDRFNDNVRLKRHVFAYLPFGEGPRICIGMRFGLLQTKTGLAMLLKNFRFTTCSKTDIPLKIDNVSLVYSPFGGVWLNIEKI